MIEFDKYGNLLPYDVVDTNLSLFDNYFVKEMKNKEHRYELYKFYINYIKRLNELITQSYFQWINGSFVTKKIKPNDIDLVSFIDYRIVEKYEPELKSFIYPLSKSIHNVDAYIVKVYPSEHEKHKLYKSDSLYWMHQFLKTKPNKQGKQMNKGFIKIDMSHEKF